MYLDNVASGVPSAALNVVRLEVSEPEYRIEHISECLHIKAILTGVDVERYKASIRKRVKAHVALGNQHETAESSWVLLIHGSDLDHDWLRNRVHTELSGCISQQCSESWCIRKNCMICSIPIYHEMHAKMYGVKIFHHNSNLHFCKHTIA